jgi:hypothetical protein
MLKKYQKTKNVSRANKKKKMFGSKLPETNYGAKNFDFFFQNGRWRPSWISEIAKKQ